ncbi:MAG: phosphoenolpyruvate mutase [Butyrivibrio sp.]
MKALILNSGIGKRMGSLTESRPKCLTRISTGETVLERQLKMLSDAGIEECVITTGPFEETLKEYCSLLDLPIQIKYVHNERYDETNYIYSIYLSSDETADSDIILMHGDLVFEKNVLGSVMNYPYSCMAVSSTLPLLQKDFKAVIRNSKIEAVGIEFFDSAIAAQPLYRINQREWKLWLDSIAAFCRAGNVKCYAENAFNAISETCPIYPVDIRDGLCHEIDTPEDLEKVNIRLKDTPNKKVYMCFSTDMIHSGHISIIKKAAKLGELTVGVLSDEAVSGYKRYPLMPFEERKILFENITGVSNVVEQKKLSYADNIRKLKPDYVVHGDDWRSGFQKNIRDEVVAELAVYGGELIEYPYSDDDKYKALDQRARAELSLPDNRRGRLRKILELKGLITAIETHSGLTGLIAENTAVYHNGEANQFDAMWISSLCDSTAKGKPDIELVDMTSRYRTIDDVMEVTTKPVIFDGDTGGLAEHFVYTVKTLERMGVSMVIIEDKKGLKKNSLFGSEVSQTQTTMEEFCAKISAGKKAQKTKDFMICARIESLILDKGVEDALQRAFAYKNAGADAVMIHSRKKDPREVFEFVERFRAEDMTTPIVVVPTAFNEVTEEEFSRIGVNVVIYANHLTRSGFPAMQNAAKMILKNHRAKECDELCMPFEDIIRLIPEDN